MDAQDITGRILAFAQHCRGTDRSAEETARSRGWLDGEGWPTEDGRELIKALDEQDATRSVFRTVL
jgi:hypothetical protein